MRIAFNVIIRRKKQKMSASSTIDMDTIKALEGHSRSMLQQDSSPDMERSQRNEKIIFKECRRIIIFLDSSLNLGP
jgi:hypothetical protein